MFNDSCSFYFHFKQAVQCPVVCQNDEIQKKTWLKVMRKVHSSTQIRVHYGIRLLLLVTGKSSLKLIFFVGLTDLRPIFWKAGWKRLTHIFRPPQCGQKSVNKCNWKNNCSCVQLQSFGKKIYDYHITHITKVKKNALNFPPKNHIIFL